MGELRYNRIRVEPISGALGAEIFGVDLAERLDNETFSDIQQAFHDHLVVFFRDQVITPDQHKDFARRFGELHIHPNTEAMKEHPEIIEVIKEADETKNWGDLWHTDLTPQPEPPLGSILYAKDVPPYSGDTHFCNMYLAYETLSDTFRRLIDGLTCIHALKIGPFQNFKSMKTTKSESISSEHPLVRTHPATGKKALFLARDDWGQIKGMSRSESDALLSFLTAHADNPDFACRFRWKKNSIAFWDNRCTRHRVTADYFYEARGFEPHRRHMHRVTVKGERPH